MQKHVHLVDLVKSFPTNIFLQTLASIQQRTSLIKFDHLEKNQSLGRYRTFQLRRPRGAWAQCTLQPILEDCCVAVVGSCQCFHGMWPCHGEWSSVEVGFGPDQYFHGAVPGLKGSIGEGSNHSNFSHQSSVKILSKFRNFR